MLLNAVRMKVILKNCVQPVIGDRAHGNKLSLYMKPWSQATYSSINIGCLNPIRNTIFIHNYNNNKDIVMILPTKLHCNL